MFTFCIQKVRPSPSLVALTSSPLLTADPTPLLQDTIRVEPRDFSKDPIDAIREGIHRRYANRVSSPLSLPLGPRLLVRTRVGTPTASFACGSKRGSELTAEARSRSSQASACASRC